MDRTQNYTFHFKWKSLIFPLFLLLIVIVGIVYVEQPQDVRNRAAANGSILALQPASVSKSAGVSFPVGITLNTGTDSVVAAELHMVYDPLLIKITGFTPGSQLPILLQPASFGSGNASIILGVNPNAYFKGSGIIGTLNVVALTNNPATITFTTASSIATIEKPSNTLKSSTGISINNGVVTITVKPTCTPRLPCMDPPAGQPACLPKITSDTVFCPKTPTPTPTYSSQCTNKPNGTFCTRCRPCTGVCPAVCIQETASCSNGQCVGPTPTQPGSQTIYIRVKLAGVTDGTAGGANIAVKFVKLGGETVQLSSPLPLTHSGNGVYTATATLTNPFPAGTKYRIKVKGEKHASVEFCRQSSQSGPCSDSEYITSSLLNGIIYDFTGISLPPGDVPPQDGKVDAADFGAIKSLMSKLCSDLTVADKLKGDLDYSGCVTVRDIFLIRQTLETRYDE